MIDAYDDDAELAGRLASSAGSLLLRTRDELARHSPAELRAAGDRRSHEFLLAELTRQRPDDAVLSEEGVDDPARLSASRVWIIDPLDGTREFAELRSDWAVHVALWSGGDLVAGAVALPDLATTLGTPDPPRPPAYDGPPRLAVSRSRPPDWVEQVRGALGGILLPMGSAGAKAMAVVRGEADAYLHGGGQYEWDSAAPVAVARAAGLHASRIDGSALRYNQADPLLPDLVICRAELAAPLLRVLASRPG